MRIAFISDIHGNLPALDAVLAQVARHDVDHLINLGDILSGPLWPQETARRLMPLKLPTIRGNHERQLLTQAREQMSPADAFAIDVVDAATLDWLRALPTEYRLGDEVLCCHGTPTSDLIYFLETVIPDHGVDGSRGVRPATAQEVRERLGTQAAARATLVACGHTHVPRMVQAAGGPLVINPGSVGLPGYDDAHPDFHIIENGAPHARWALAERDPSTGRWSVALMATAYDWHASAARALANGRPDWADALATGFVGRRESELA